MSPLSRGVGEAEVAMALTLSAAVPDIDIRASSVGITHILVVARHISVSSIDMSRMPLILVSP